MLNNKSDMRALLFLLPVALVVFVSGCTLPGPGPGAGGPGVSINAFQSDFTQVYSNEEIKLQLEVQNNGDVKATNVQAELAGISTEEWGTFVDIIEIGDLLPVQTQQDGSVIQGETRTIQWTDLFAPYLVRGTQFTYSPEVRVSYDYATTAQKPITIVDEDELRNIIAAGETLPGKATTYSSGPISINIETGNYVKTSQTGSGSTFDIFPVNIHIENTQFTSGSTVVKPLVGIGPETYPVLVEIIPPAGTNFVYSGYGQDCSQFVVIDLFRGRDADITCELEVTNPPSISQEGLITVNLEYRYALDAQTQVTVLGI